MNKDAAELLLTSRACCCAGIHCSSSPQCCPIEKQKMKVCTKCEQWKSCPDSCW